MPPSVPPTLERIDHVHVYVADRAAALPWYASVLGFSPVPELEFWAADGGPLTVSNRSGTIHLALFERGAQTCRSTIALAADAAEFLAWRAHLEAALGQLVAAVDHQVSWSMYFADPDANPFEITSDAYAVLAPLLGKAGGLRAPAAGLI